MRAAPLGACRALLAGGAAIAAASAIALPSAARGAGRPVRAAGTVRAAATVRALPTRSGRPAGTASRPRVVPLLFRAPRPATLGRRSSRSAEGTRTAGPAPSAPAAGVFGATLDQPGLSAAGELSLVSPPGVTPPDSTGAIGPTAYIEIVNSQIAIWSRADLTTMVASSGLDSFTGGTSTCDPQIRFDPQSGRWFYSALRCDMTPNQNQLYVGWSKTADPTTLGPSDWCTYTIPTTPSTSLDDYDKLGIDGGHVIIGANLFTASSLQFQTAQILVAAKPPAGTITSCGPAPVFTVFGSPSSPLRTSIGNLAFTPEPATVSDGTWAAGYVVAADFDDPQDVSGSHLMLWRVGDSGPHPSLTAAGDVPVSPFSAPARGVAQPSGGDPIDPLDGRLTQAVMSLDPNVSGATEAIWTQHTVDDGSGGTEVRWYEVVPSTLGEHAHGTVTSPAGFAFNGAIAPTLSGGAVIDFNTGGSSQKVDVEAQAMTSSAGTMTPLASPLATSSAIDTDFSCPSSAGAPPCRWGDYAAATPDPNCSEVAWGSSQLNDTPTGPAYAQWHAWNFAVTPSSSAIQPCFTASPDPAPAGTSVSFDAAGTVDSGGTPNSWSWDFGDPASGSSNTASGETASHLYASPGTYTVTLTVTDNHGNTDTTTHTITVVGPPSASFVPSTTDTVVGRTVTFDASASSDSGTTLNYAWDFGDGSSATGDPGRHSYGAAGTYNVTLTASNGFGASASTSHGVTVVGPLSASFSASPTPAPVNSTVTFDSSGSTDPGTTITSYLWSFGDGTTSTSPSPTHVYSKAGAYSVQLTEGDGFGQASTASRTVTVVGPPTASFTASPPTATAGAPISFDATGSTDPGTPIVAYSWTFGDGSSGTGANASHAYHQAGAYTVSLTVSDAFGESDTATRAVTVVGPPTASFTASPRVVAVGLPVRFDASGSRDVGTTITAYSWSFGDGRTGSGVRPSHTYRRAGTYRVTLAVGDSFGATATAVGTVIVKPLQARLSVPGGQRAARALAHGLVVVMTTNEPATASFRITARGRRGPTLAARRLRLRAGRRTITLRLRPAATRAAMNGRTLMLTVRVSLSAAFGQRRTTSALVRLRA